MDGRWLAVGALGSLVVVSAAAGSRGVVRRKKHDPCSHVEKGTILKISSSHIEESDSRWLDDSLNGTVDAPFIGGRTGYGWVISLSSATTETIDEADVSDAFRTVIDFALGCGADWLLFDRDAPVIEELPTFIW